MPARPLSSSLSTSDLQYLSDIEHSLVTLHLAFSRLSDEGWRAVDDAFVPLSNGVLDCYFERLDRAA